MEYMDYAIKQIGTKETDTNEIEYNDWYYGKHVKGDEYPWCCVFICWCLDQSSQLNLIKRKTNACRFFESDNADLEVIDMPRYGDVVTFKFNGSKTANHIGFVYKVEDDRMYTIEGNHNNEVAIVKRKLSSYHKLYRLTKTKIDPYIIQSILKLFGYDLLIDGIIGKETTKCIKSFIEELDRLCMK